MAKAKTSKLDVVVPSQHDWRTTDDDEINRRRERAQTEEFRVSNLDPRHPIFSNFRVQSGSGMKYSVEIRDLRERQFVCDCVDFRINGLGTCKHAEAVLMYLEARHKKLVRGAKEEGSPRIDLVPDPENGTIRLLNGHGPLPKPLLRWFDAGGGLKNGSPEEALEAIKLLAETTVPHLRLSQDLDPWLESRRRSAERISMRREYELKVQSGEWPVQETRVPLFPYQREGMLHLAFTERALLADEMGLGKTIQGIAACALLARLGRASRVLVVTPASLKTEWEDQIQRFTTLSYQLVFGPRHARVEAYCKARMSGGPFFTIVNYEQMLADALDVNEKLSPDIIVLDEAQRIKNWSTKTTRAVKRLKSRYAFVLTGTPIENRIDELYSLMDFLNPTVLGPLFRFNREYYTLNDRGRPEGYRNLEKLHERIAPCMLRRRKSQVETELPARTVRTFFVPLSEEQVTEYEDHKAVVSRLAAQARRRPLTRQEQERMMMNLAMMRMVCDTNYILIPDQRACPKLAELEKILEECRDNPEVKVIIFSEWERMLELVRSLCKRIDLGFAWHTGSVPQQRRRAEINLFKNDPGCRVFLSTDSGATGLNLQVASVVINCDLPWNPAKLEQRIARAWRKNQTRPVTVINLVSENTIEHSMLETLSNKQALSDGVLDLKGDLKEIKLRSGGQAFLDKLKQLIAPMPEIKPEAVPPKPPLPVDRPLGFARALEGRINGALLRCEERFPKDGPHSVLFVVVDRDAALWREKLNALHEEYFGPGKADPLSPVRLEIIDRTTDEALQRMMDAGLVARSTRAIRPLWPADSTGAAPQPLSEAEREQAKALRQQAARKLKMARVLAAGELQDESRSALSDGILVIGKALAVENRLTEPKSIEETLLSPLALVWKEALPLLRAFVQDASHPINPVLGAVEKM